MIPVKFVDWGSDNDGLRLRLNQEKKWPAKLHATCKVRVHVRGYEYIRYVHEYEYVHVCVLYCRWLIIKSWDNISDTLLGAK